MSRVVVHKSKYQYYEYLVNDLIIMKRISKSSLHVHFNTCNAGVAMFDGLGADINCKGPIGVSE